MIGFTRQLEVEIDPALAFEVLADMTRLDQWNPNVSSSRLVSGQPFGLGSRYESTIVRGPIQMIARSALVAIEPGRMVRYEGSIASFWSVDQLTFEHSSRGARITFHNETRSPRALRVFDPTVNAVFQRQARRAVEGALRLIRSEVP